MVQLDISKSVLTWARRNAGLQNNPGAGELRYIPEDTSAFLAREVRRIEKGRPRYDTVIMDPPVFGSSNGVRFVQERELPMLVRHALLLLAPGGELYLSSNRVEVTPEDLALGLLRAASEVGKRIADRQVLLPPQLDFTAQGAASTAMRGVRIIVD